MTKFVHVTKYIVWLLIFNYFITEIEALPINEQNRHRRDLINDKAVSNFSI